MRDFFLHTHDLLLRGGAAVMGFFHGMGTGEHRCGLLLLCLMAADYITGVIAALLGKSPKTSRGKLSSTAGFKGLLHKAVMLLVLMLSAVLDWFIHDQNAMFFSAVCWMYIGNEALSLLENLALCGVPVPKGLKQRLEQFSGAKEQPVRAAPPALQKQLKPDQ